MLNHFEGRIFTTIDDGMNYVNEVGFEEIIERGAHVASQLPSDIIYAGVSLGVLAAQKLAQRDSPLSNYPSRASLM